MERLRVVDLKEIAKSKGLRGYSKLRKAELINFLKSNTPKGIVIFVEEEEEEPEVCQLLSAGSLLENKKKRKAEKKAEKRKRKAEKNRKKRESKKRNKNRPLHVDIDQLVKDIEESEALKRKDDRRRLDDVSSRAFKLVETESSFNKFVRQYKIEEVEDEEVNKETRKNLEKQIKRLKKKKRKAKDGKRKRSLQNAIDGKVKERHRPFKEIYEPKRFLSTVKPTILTFLRENPDPLKYN